MKQTLREVYRAFVFKCYNLKRIIKGINEDNLYYVIGDSHTLCFQHEVFKIFHIGPATAYKLNFENSTTKSREKVLTILNKIYKDQPINVIFIFGEIDTRIHINKISYEKNIKIDKVIENTVKAYMEFLNFIKKKYPLINIYVFNLLPQGEEDNIYNYPFYASREKRMKIAEKMNLVLRRYIKKNKFKFIYIYDYLIDKGGNRKKEYIYDLIHYNRRIIPLVLENLKKLSSESNKKPKN